MKEIPTKLEMKATAALTKQVEAELQHQDKPLSEVIDKKKDEADDTKRPDAHHN